MQTRVVVLLYPRERRLELEPLWARLGIPPEDKRRKVGFTTWADSPEFSFVKEFLRETGIVHTLREEIVYTGKELASFPYLHLTVVTYAGSGGNYYGTLYDRSSSCLVCGTGGVQTTHLVIDKAEMGRKDIAVTYEFDYLLSGRLARAMEMAGCGGYKLWPVRHKNTRSKLEGTEVYQIVSANILTSMISPTVFVTSAQYCQTCGKRGLFPRSEFHYRAEGFEAKDINFTREWFGEGAFPRPRVVISQKVYQLLKSHKVRFLQVEPVHLIDVQDAAVPALVPQGSFEDLPGGKSEAPARMEI